MTVPNLLGDYKVVSDKVRSVLSRRIAVVNPFLSPDSSSASGLEPFRSVIASGRKSLPRRYHTLYLEVLEAALNQAEKSMAGKSAQTVKNVREQLAAVFGTLSMPIVQLEQKDHSLKAYLSVVSNLYRRFLEDDRVAEKLKESGYLTDLDPLGFFVDSDDEPYTIAPTRDMPLAFIAKPVQYADFAPLYFIEGHEVGGHVLLSKINGFSAEIKELLLTSVRKTLRAGSLPSGSTRVKVPRKPGLFRRPFKEVAVSTFLSEVFATWSQELFCDACGVLNLGPAYVNGLILVLSQTNRKRKLSRTSSFSLVNGVSSHPFDVLRVLFSIAVLERLRCSGQYIADLNARFKEACGGTLPQELIWLNAIDEPAIKMELEDFRALVEEAATLIVERKLKSLKDRSLKDFCTWGESDEATTSQLLKELLCGDLDEELPVEARHVVAASMLAMERLSVDSAADFQKQSQRVNELALDLLAELYEEQCLLCDTPAYNKTRRQDLFNLEKLASHVSHPDRF